MEILVKHNKFAEIAQGLSTQSISYRFSSTSVRLNLVQLNFQFIFFKKIVKK